MNGRFSLNRFNVVFVIDRVRCTFEKEFLIQSRVLESLRHGNNETATLQARVSPVSLALSLSLSLSLALSLALCFCIQRCYFVSTTYCCHFLFVFGNLIFGLGVIANFLKFNLVTLLLL